MTSPFGIVVVPLAGSDLSLSALTLGKGTTRVVVCNPAVVPVGEEAPLGIPFGKDI